MNLEELHHDETLYTPVLRPPLPVNMSKIKWSPNLNIPCWVLAFQDSANSSITTLRSIPRRQAGMPSAGLPECLTPGRTCQMYHSIVQRTQLFPEEHWIPESFSRTPMPPEKPALHLGAGHLSQVPLFWCSGRRSLAVLERCLCHESRSPVDRCPELPAIEHGLGNQVPALPARLPTAYAYGIY